MSFNFHEETRNSWNNYKDGNFKKEPAPDGIHSATLKKCEIIVSKNTGNIYLKWFFSLDICFQDVEKLSDIEGKFSGWTRSDFEFVSKQVLPDMEETESKEIFLRKIKEIVALVSNIPVTLKISHKDDKEFINFVKEQKKDEYLNADPIPAF
jgi:hypothetical protein